MARRKAKGVPLASVARSVEKAVKLAAARHDVKLAGETLLNGWEIMGKRYPSNLDLGVAFAVATDITNRVKISGLRIEPAVKSGRMCSSGLSSAANRL